MATAVCTLSETCYDQDGDPLASVTAFATILDRPYDDGTYMYSTYRAEGSYDVGTGVVSWDIVRGARVLIEILEIGLHKKFTVPDLASARIGDMTEE